MHCSIIGYNDNEYRRKPKNDEHSAKDNAAKGDSAQGWQEAKGKKKSRTRKNGNANVGTSGVDKSVGKNAKGVEETTHLAEELASYEAKFRAAAELYEKEKQDIAAKLVLAGRSVVGETTASIAKPVLSDELARMNP